MSARREGSVGRGFRGLLVEYMLKFETIDAMSNESDIYNAWSQVIKLLMLLHVNQSKHISLPRAPILRYIIASQDTLSRQLPKTRLQELTSKECFPRVSLDNKLPRQLIMP